MVDPKQSDGGNRRGAIAGLAIAVILIAGGLWLAHALSAQSKLQDCLMSGRTNCNRSCKKGDFVPPAHMITPTREREIAAYVWVHPDDER
jgi:hypothetical protein